MANRIDINGLSVEQVLHGWVVEALLPGTGIAATTFWAGLADIVTTLGPTNQALLERREVVQAQIDAWHCDRRGTPHDAVAYRRFLEEIGYLQPEGEPFAVAVTGVDDEIATLAGPQLVVPVTNARYVLNAANARWGSLYDALYGTDAVDEADGATRAGPFNPVRGARVVARAAAFLDETVPLAGASHARARRYAVSGGTLRVTVGDGEPVALVDGAQFVGYRGAPNAPHGVLLRQHGLHIEIQIDAGHPIGQAHAAGVKDVLLEAALTTIVDCEDSVACVDAQDKVLAYDNWLGLMRGTLEAAFAKGGTTVQRRLAADREYTMADGGTLSLPGRSLLLVRNCGLHMYTDAVTVGGTEIPEGFLDALVTALAAVHDLKGRRAHANSRTGSIYIVKPKLHGPEEVAATVALFARVEEVLGLARNTLKIGIMDEERRTTVNLLECIRAARERVFFINTGFLDRTGDEIHTSMEAGAFLPKPELKAMAWIAAYEDRNVDIGIAAGLPGVAQIGKGMWAMPDEMAAMLESKVAHPRAGASTAWVPSPTAATLHAMHYHAVDVAERQSQLAARPRAGLADILSIPLLQGRNLSAREIAEELENNAQGVLGYVVRWVDQGIGCSKVPDINDVGLMEDRATLRISCQHVANWLHHGIVSAERVRRTFEKMAAVVDRQNAGDEAYSPMAPDFAASVAFRAALALVFTGRSEPNGYTEPTLHRHRREVKATRAALP